MDKSQMLDPASISYILLTMLTLPVMIILIWNKVTSKYKYLYCPFNFPLFGSTIYMENEPYKLTKQFEKILAIADHKLILWMG